MQLQHYINHISLVVDKSGSMSGMPVEDVFDRELNYLKQRSIDLNQETRISIYLFNDKVECLTFDMDVMRFNTLKGHYKSGGNTALIDAVLKSTEDNKKLPELYGDHAFLQYVITDGQENSSKNRKDVLAKTLQDLPDNWSTACLVPNQNGAMNAEKFGFNGGSICIWDTKATGAFEAVGKQFSKTIDSYMTMRSTGTRGTKALFTTMTAENISKKDLTEMDSACYDVLPVHKDGPIKEYVEAFTKAPYRLGSTYYQPTKPVIIQDHKNILVQDVKNGRVYEGSNLRQLLGLPAATANVNPSSHKDWRIFVQSTSVNRKLFTGTFILIRK